MELSDIIEIGRAERSFEKSLVSKIGIDVDLEKLTTLNQARSEFRTYFVYQALVRNNYNVTKTAKELGINRKTIQRLQNKQEEQKLDLYSGKEAIKKSIHRVLDHYLPNTEKNNDIVNEKAEALSQYFKSKKITLEEATKEFEGYVVQIAERITDSKTEAAKMLGVSERTMSRRLRKEDLKELYKSICYN